MRHTSALIAIAALLLVTAGARRGGTLAMTHALDKGLTAVPGVRVGHHTLDARPTGCTVVLFDAGAVGGVEVRGASPGTRETDLLAPGTLVNRVDAIVLAGGSAFGLDAAQGVMRYLEEREIGYPTSAGPVPIVPAAIIFDLPIGGAPAIRPTAECGYKAAQAAGTGPVAEGSVGAGAGATVGKIAGLPRAMKAGVGSVALAWGDFVVAALAVVNAVGDVIDPDTGRVVAGVRTADGRGLADARQVLRTGDPSPPRPGEHTTLGIVATNARLDQTQATRVARAGQSGVARAVFPAHTPYDGDTVFAVGTGVSPAPIDHVALLRLSALASEAMARAIVRAATQAEARAGYPAVRDLDPPR